jgi:hypothetical protein
VTTADVISGLFGCILLLAVLSGTVFLAYKHIIDGPATVAILSSIISLAGGALAVHSGVKAGAKAAGLEPKK